MGSTAQAATDRAIAEAASSLAPARSAQRLPPGASGSPRRCYLFGVNLVRRYRSAIMLVFGLVMLGSMTYAFLQRVGVDPLASLRGESAEEER